MALSKAKSAAVAAVVVLLVAGAATTAVQWATSRSEAIAPPPTSTTVVTGTGSITGSSTGSGGLGAPAAWGPVSGVVRTPDGRPVAGATVELVPMYRTVLIYGRTDDVQTTKTGADGKFELVAGSEPAAVIVRTPKLIGTGVVSSPGKPLKVTAVPWGRITGTILANGKPLPNADLFLWQPVVGPDVDRSRWIDRNAYIRSDSNGRFTVERVLPGTTRIDVRDEGGLIERSYGYDVSPGQTVVASLAEVGRPIAGRVVPALPAATYRHGALRPLPPAPPALLGDGSRLPVLARSVLEQMWQRSPEYQAWIKDFKSRPQVYQFRIRPDGSFGIRDIPPGRYELQVRLGEAEPDGRLIAENGRGVKTITVPPIDNDAPTGITKKGKGATTGTAAATAKKAAAVRAGPGPSYDLGEVKLELTTGLTIGGEVPPIAGRDPTGKPIALRDFRGRYVLLHVVRPHGHDDTELLKVIHDRFADDRLVMVTAHLAAPTIPDRIIDHIRRGRPSPPQASTQAAPTTGATTQPARTHSARREPAPPQPERTGPVQTGPAQPEPARAPMPMVTPLGVSWPEILPSADTSVAGAGLVEELTQYDARLLLIDPEGKLMARASVSPAALDLFARALATPQGAARTQRAGVKVTVEHVPVDQAKAETPFKRVPPPAADDAAKGAAFSTVANVVSTRDGAGGLPRLNDGRLQPHKDSPAQSAFFEWGTLEGRFKIDLGRAVAVAAINTYSWHKDDRGPQVYNVFGSDGAAANFNAAPGIGTDLTKCGWTKIATVDTRLPEVRPGEFRRGGRYGVSITAPAAAGGALGTYRYVLFEVFVTETRDQWGHTLYGEVDVIEKK